MGGVVFSSVIKIDDEGKWYIELTDLTDGRKEICFDLDEYEEKIEKLGDDYGGHVDEVKWSVDENVPPFIIDEIRLLMAQKRAKIEEERGDFITPVATPKEES